MYDGGWYAVGAGYPADGGGVYEACGTRADPGTGDCGTGLGENDGPCANG